MSIANRLLVSMPVRSWSSPLASLCLVAPALANGVRIADAPHLGLFNTLQAAIDAAPPGGLLLVEAGIYPAAVVDGKSLSIVELPGAVARTNGTLTIRNLSAGQRVLVTGIELKSTVAPGLRVQNCAGHVRIEGCKITGGRSPAGSEVYRGEPGVLAQASTQIVLASCPVFGGDAGYASGYPGLPGGDGILTSNSNVALFDSAIRGGTGTEEGVPGGNGGDACHIVGWGIFASGCTFLGGHGGGGDYIGCTDGGIGGDAIDVTGGQAQLYATTLTAGAGGWRPCGPPSASGQTVVTSGATVNQFGGSARRLAGRSVESDDAHLTLTFTGQPGDRAYLVRSPTLHYAYQASWHGIWLASIPTLAAVAPLGLVPPSGTLVVDVSTLRMNAVGTHAPWTFQGLGIDVTNQRFLTGPVDFELLNRAGGPDCDRDRLNDIVDLLEGSASDCDHNIVPDACDIARGDLKDCNGNGVPDTCEIASHVVPDCNGNSVPDSCELASGAVPDCNGNGRPDSCDITAGTSLDVNGNGRPDECEVVVPRTLWVDAAALPGGNGSTATPYRTIAEGLADSFHGDTVIVRDGTYTGALNRNLDPNGRRVFLRSEHGPALCVVDCSGLGRFMRIDSHESPLFILDGFTIRNGVPPSTGADAYSGGGLYVDNADPTIRNCLFENCSAMLGGGMRAMLSSLRVENCTFVDCRAVPPSGSNGQGGGIHYGGGSAQFQPTISGCEFRNCSAIGDGGALHLGGYAPIVLTRCRIVGNSATLNGGGIVARFYGPTTTRFLRMDDCLVAGNTAASGGGISMNSTYAGSTLPAWSIANSTFVGNVGSIQGGALLVYGGSFGVPPLEIHNSILYGNQSPAGPALFHSGGHASFDVQASDIENGLAGFLYGPTATLTFGAGNLAVDPVFASPGGLDGNPLTFGDNDYRLSALSPCIDAGDNALVPPDLADADGDGDFLETVPRDLAGLARFVDVTAVPDTGQGVAPIVDCGAFEREP